MDTKPISLREAFAVAGIDKQDGLDRYERTFQIMYGRLPSHDEREMIRRRCLWYEQANGSHKEE